MSRTSGSAFLFIFVVGTIVSALWQLPRWFKTGGHPSRRLSAEVLAEAGTELEDRQVLIRTVRARGTLKRETWNAASGQWDYAGENSSSGVYEYGPGGRVRVQCTREVDLPVESQVQVERGATDYPEREFTAVFDGKGGETVITRQGGAKTGGDGRVVVELEKGRPPRMDECDESTGWRYAFFGWWIGGGENDGGTVFSEVVHGKETGTTVSGKDVDVEMTPSMLITMMRADKVEMYWLDINQGYSIWRWEEHEKAADAGGKKEAAGRLVRDAHVTDFWAGPKDIYYPRHLETQRDVPDGTPVEREKIEVAEVSFDNTIGGDEVTAVNVPAGEVVVKQGEKEPTISGMAESNGKAVGEMLKAMEK